MMDNFKEKYDTLVRKYDSLLAENEELKSILRQYGIAYSTTNRMDEESVFSSISFPPVYFSLDEKIELFHSFFKGRMMYLHDDGSAKPQKKVAINQSVSTNGVEEYATRKNINVRNSPNRNFASLTNQDIYRHLEGKDENGCDVIGLYVITPDNKCSFLCADFDDKNCTHGYKDDVLAFVSVCRDWNVPCSIERSRSGNGAHVWVFFTDAIPAIKVRRFGNIILTEAMKRNGRISFDSYDRFFPNQDRIPEGGFGNLIALPLQGGARKVGNSVFVDDKFLPFKDQWAYLYNVKRIDECVVDRLLVEHQQEDFGALATSSEAKPWEIPIVQEVARTDFDSKLKINKSDNIYIPLSSISSKVINQLKRFAAFKNPDFYSKQAMRISTYNIPRIICRADFNDEFLVMPRGCEEAIIAMLSSLSIDYEIIDKTNHANLLR